MKNNRLWAFSLALCLVIAVAVPLAAQQNGEKPTSYTYVAEWSVPRAQWGEIDKNSDAERPIMDKLLAEGTITGYGSYSHLIHAEGEPTHGSWFSATSEGNLLKALEAIYAQPAMVTSPSQAASKHWDRLFQSTVYNGKAGKFGGYLTYSRWQLKPGQMAAYNQLMNKIMVPVLEKLLADGTITSYGTDMDDYHTAPIGVIYEYMTVPDAASLDKANKAIDDAFAANPALSSAYRSLFETEGHRDYMTRLRYMVNK